MSIIKEKAEEIANIFVTSENGLGVPSNASGFVSKLRGVDEYFTYLHRKHFPELLEKTLYANLLIQWYKRDPDSANIENLAKALKRMNIPKLGEELKEKITPLCSDPTYVEEKKWIFDASEILAQSFDLSYRVAEWRYEIGLTKDVPERHDPKTVLKNYWIEALEFFELENGPEVDKPMELLKAIRKYNYNDEYDQLFNFFKENGVEVAKFEQ